MKELARIYKELGQDFVNDLFKDYLVVTEKLSGSAFSFEKSGSSLKFFKSNDKPINLVDRTLMVYYEKPINYIKDSTDSFMDSIPGNWRFCFQYFVHNEPGVIRYDKLPKNNLVLTHILVKNPNGKVTKIIEDPRVIEDWSNALGVTPLLPIFKGYLTDEQKESIKKFIKTPIEDQLEIFKTSSFAEYLIKVLNPKLSSTILQDDLSKPVESIIFKFYKTGGTQIISAKLIDPYTANLLKHREPIDPKKAPADVNEILLLDILAFIEERGLRSNELLTTSPDERYLELVSSIFNDYIVRRGKGIADLGIERADFAKGDEFKLNVDLIPSQATQATLKQNEKMQDLFKIMLGSLRKKRNPDKPGNVLTPSVIEDFNALVSKIEDAINKPVDDKFKTFSDYLNLKKTNESYQTAEDLILEEKVLSYNNFINLGKVIIEADVMDQKIKNPETGREVKVSSALNYDKDTPVYKKAKEVIGEKEPKESEGKLGDLVKNLDDKIKDIKDPEQKENAQTVLSAVKVFNDPNATMEDKVKEVQKLNDAGLIARNSVTAKSKKMYLDTSLTGLPRKELVPGAGSPSDIVKAMEEYGLENIQPEGGKINRKDMTAAKLFGEDKVVKAEVKVGDNGIEINGGKIEKTKIPTDEQLLAVYGSEKEAMLAKKQLERRNKIIDKAIESFKGGELSIIEPVPNTPPTTQENRDKLKNATGDTIVKGFEEQFEKTGKTPTSKQRKVLDDFKALKDIKDPKEYDKELHRLTEEMFADPFMDSATTDVVEMVTYMSELNKGNQVYMPSASNYPLGDVISISPEKVDFEKDSPEEIQRKLQLIYNGVEARSIKKNAGGASASGEKTELSTFKSFKNKKGEEISSDEIKDDLSQLSDKTKLYKEIYDGDPDKARETIDKLAEKYDFDLEEPSYKARREQSVKSAIDNILSKPKCEGTDRGKLEKKLNAYFDQGSMYENTYNNSVTEQLFVNEQYKYSKTKGLEVNRTDGITKIAKLVFAFSAGAWSCDGRPSNPVPTRFKNVDIEDSE
jgi:hypothetical protein